jgi:hypothetical protein
MVSLSRAKRDRASEVGPGPWRRVAYSFIISTKMMKVHHRVHRPARGLRHREYLLAKVVWLAAVAISLQVSGQVRTPEGDRECPPFHRPLGHGSLLTRPTETPVEAFPCATFL